MNYGIGNVKGKGGVSNTMLTTTTDATENSGTYTLDLTYLSETPKVNDYVVYVNSGNLTTLYKVTAVDSTNATLTKIGDIGGGSTVIANPTLAGTESDLTGIEIDDIKYEIKKKYKHNITMTLNLNNSMGLSTINLSLENNSNTPLTFATMVSLLESKGFTPSYIKMKECSGGGKINSILSGSLIGFIGITSNKSSSSNGIYIMYLDNSDPYNIQKRYEFTDTSVITYFEDIVE